MSGYLVSTTFAKSRVNGFTQLCSDKVLHETLIKPFSKFLDANPSFIALDELVDFEKKIVEKLDTPEIGIHLSRNCEKYKQAQSGMVGALAASCDTIGEAFLMAVRYNNLLSDGVKIQLIEKEDKAEFIYYRKAKSAKTIWDAETSIIDTYDILKNYGEIYSIEFEFSAPSYKKLYTKVFNCDVSFDAPVNKISFNRSALKKENPLSQPYVNEIIVEKANKDSENLVLRSRFENQVKTVVGQHLSKGVVSVDFVADQLHMSRQNLHKKLKEEQTSFTKILEDYRKTVALEVVASKSHTLTELAFILGFSELSSFSRAYKKWFGKSPSG